MVLDTSAFLAGFNPCSISEDQATVSKVQEEIKTNSMTWVRFKTAVENGKLKVKAPSEEFLNKAKASANLSFSFRTQSSRLQSPNSLG
jgi:rRNA maturation endonuclease Nob1